jgi:hypothetical protein
LIALIFWWTEEGCTKKYFFPHGTIFSIFLHGHVTFMVKGQGYKALARNLALVIFAGESCPTLPATWLARTLATPEQKMSLKPCNKLLSVLHPS